MALFVKNRKYNEMIELCKKHLNYYFTHYTHPLAQRVLTIFDKIISESKDKLASWDKEMMEQKTCHLLWGILFQELGKGYCYIFRGVLSPDGEEIRRALESCIIHAHKMGYMDDKMYELNMERIEYMVNELG